MAQRPSKKKKATNSWFQCECGSNSFSLYEDLICKRCGTKVERKQFIKKLSSHTS